MTEVRTTSSTGGEKGVKPERHDLIPRRAVGVIARVFGFGAKKYADHNWRKKYEWGKSIAAMQRHIDAFVDGETYDEESGLPHLAHAGFHILVLLTWLEEDGEGVDNEFDDRWPAAMRRAEIKALQDKIASGTMSSTEAMPHFAFDPGPGPAGASGAVQIHQTFSRPDVNPGRLAEAIRKEVERVRERNSAQRFTI